MIVKNEAAVIRRCLTSVKPLISHWVICDTGSTDNTCQIITETIGDIPGTLHHVPWVNFGFNRSQALQLARGKADYRLMVDADEVVKIEGKFPERLTADAYLLRFEGKNDYHLPLLLSDRHDWRYEGVTHEVIPYSAARPWVKLRGVSIVHHEDGGSRADKFDRDIRLLTQGIEQEPDNARYHFYLAQSYRDIGRYAEALTWYEKRSRMPGWEEETWYARYQVARMLHRLNREWPLVQNHYLAAHQARPARLEPLYYLSRYYREMNQFELGYLFSRPIVDTPYPDDILFIERDIYEHAMPMEHAFCCHFTGRHGEAVAMCERVLAGKHTPPEVGELAKQLRQASTK